eukprot:snap_masked-scaffold_28-processed-gene-4.69-mRNA-1 protein AED:1.00 eAED:1.00 QI:0/0/0/0/1/1/2/0/65
MAKVLPLFSQLHFLLVRRINSLKLLRKGVIFSSDRDKFKRKGSNYKKIFVCKNLQMMLIPCCIYF